jgi:hypothetical protein
MRPRHYSYTPEAAATNSISLSQAVVGAAALTQTGTYGANGFPSELLGILRLHQVQTLAVLTSLLSILMHS